MDPKLPYIQDAHAQLLWKQAAYDRIWPARA